MVESRASIMERFRKKIAAGSPIVGGGAGTGISAKCEEAGGIDLIVIYNSGRFRMAGRGSMAGMMPYGNANAIVREMAHEVLTAISCVPVLAGVCATDPFMIRDRFLRELKDMGFAGIQNFPTVGLIDGVFRANLEETGMGFAHEIACIAAAHELDLLTTPYAFNLDQARLLTEAGADIIVAHMGLTTRGTIGPRRRSHLAIAFGRSRTSRMSVKASVPTCSCSATADQSPCLSTPNSFSTACRPSTASTAPARWSDSPPSRRSPSKSATSWASNSVHANPGRTRRGASADAQDRFSAAGHGPPRCHQCPFPPPAASFDRLPLM